MSRAAGWTAVAVGSALLAAAVHLATVHDGRAPMEAAGKVPSPVTRSAAPPAAAASPEPSGSTPTRLVITAIGVDAAVVPEAIVGGAFQLPADPHVVGWWSAGGRPGTASGTVLLAGHVDSAATGPGALFQLDATPIGATIVVRGPGGTARYRVVARRAYAKAQLPQDIFDSSGAPRLVVVTCGGAFNTATHHYADNIVVYAVPAS